MPLLLLHKPHPVSVSCAYRADATTNTVGTTVVHHEFHRGIIIPALMPPPPRGLGLANMLGGVLKRMDTDMFSFITGQQTQPSP